MSESSPKSESTNVEENPQVASIQSRGESTTELPASDQKPQDPIAGHSLHGEAFNEGPRQQAFLLPGMGKVSFPVTTSSADGQEFFNQGIAQLHGFWYFESERTFRRVAQLDPRCAMAYWGMAMSNRENDQRAKGFIAEAVKLRDSATRRERRYIDALNAYLTADEKIEKKERATQLAQDLESLVLDFPNDLEGKALLVAQYWLNTKADVPIQSHLAVDALIQEVLSAQPAHPAHHYRIHLWDSKKPERALASAAACGSSAPGIAHMWHMPGHTYAKLNRYSDSAWHQEASARVDHRHLMRYGVLPDQIHNFAHNNEWLIRNLIHVGRVSDAAALAKNMIELPRHPKFNGVDRAGSSAAYGRARLLNVLSAYELWDDLLLLADSPYLPLVEDRLDQVERWKLLGIAHCERGDVSKAETLIGQLTVKAAEWEAKQQAAVDAATQKATAEGKQAHEIEEVGAVARQSEESGLKEAKEALNVLIGFTLAAKGDPAAGYARLKDCDSVDAMAKCRILLKAGKKEEALSAARQHVDSHPNEVQPLGGLVELLWMAEHRDEAVATFEQLRRLSENVDLQAPLFARLSNIAKTLAWNDDWRLPASNPGDLAERPALETLGPFRWSPSPAPPFSLPDATGELYSLEQFQGRPLVMVFYLGHGCLHCAEQLKAIEPLAAEFEKKGISLLAISSDDLATLKQSVAEFGANPFSFPLVSDPNLEVFRAYRAYDDFEQKPLHGTFAIDGQGRVAWQDISFEPFMNIGFILDEIMRQTALQRFSGR